MTLAIVLIFTIGSVSAQSVDGSDGLSNKSLKSNSAKTAIMVTGSKVATNAKVTNGKNTKTTTTTKTSAAKKTASKESGTKAKSSKANTTTINKKTLAKTSTSFMNYVEKNGKFPKVKISNKNYSNAEYLYLVSKAVENNSNSKIEIRNKLVKPYNNTKSKSVKGSINKTEYVKMAGKTRKFIEKNQRAPNWVSSSKGKIPCNQLILMYSKCLDTYNKTGKLPNAVKLDGLDLDTIKSKLNNKSKSTTIISSAKVKAGNKTNSSKTATANKTTTKNTSITKTTEAKKSDKTETNTAENPIGQSNKTLAEKSLDYVQSLLNNILDRLDPSKFKIDLTKSDEGNVKFNTSKFNVDVSGKTSVNVQISAKNTTKTTTTKKTTTKKTTSNKTTAASSKKTTTKKTTSTAKKTSAKTTAKKSTAKTIQKISQALKAYLSSSKNCQVTNKEIKSLATKLTSTLKSDYDKGKKLFEWVRDHIGYDKYRNTRRGAVKTLQNRLGNCVDQSHLLVALSRAAGIPARYVNGNNCRFTTGYVSGHVWTEMYIKNKWTVADTTSSRNSLGTIRNWNTKSFSLVGKYSGINF